MFQTERVNKFKEKFKEDDEKGAFEQLQVCSSRAAEVEMLRIVVNSRKNDLITKVLSTTLQKQYSGDDVDTTCLRNPVVSNDLFQVRKKQTMTH